MADLLIEIGTEELPPSAIGVATRHIGNSLSRVLRVRDIKIYSTPRRLVFYVENFEDTKAVEEEIIYGPPWQVAFGDGGVPTKALEGFLKRYGATKDQVFKASKGKGEYVAIKLLKGERSALEELKENFEEILLSIPFPRRMRWTSSRRILFSRPVRWILALYGDALIDLAFGEVKSSRITYGHRFLSGGRVEVSDPSDYFAKMEGSYVMLDRDRRKELIDRSLREEANKLSGEPVMLGDLLEEVTDLVEYPFPVVGSFEDRFLELPERVIITVLAHHQRFFCVKRGESLINHFIGISNNRPSGGEIRRGYERVIRARLEDALFFYREDLRRPLSELVPRLSGILIHPKVGTVLDKTRRMEKIADYLISTLGLGEIRERVLKAVRLSKADLLTEMVKEFDELQGYMGMVYALKDGEEEEVAKALYEQYLPSGQDSDLPQTTTGAILSLTDKLHDLIYFFSAGEIPTGASDPYGLRRSAFGVLRVLDNRRWDLDIKDLMRLLEVREGYKELEEFMAQRLESYLEDRGYDVVRSVLAVTSSFRPSEVIDKVRKVSELKSEDSFTALYDVYRRIAKILPEGWESEQVDETLLKEPAERSLWDKVIELENSELSDPMGLTELQNPVNRLFDEVLIMDRDERIRSNRLSLLFRVKRLFNRFADFSLLVPQEVK